MALWRRSAGHVTDNFRSDTKEPNNSFTYITTFRILTIKKATFISVKLANKAYIHLLIALELTIKSAMEPYIETDLFAYNIAIIIIL